MNDLLETLNKNIAETEYLYNYYLGVQPVLQKQKLYRPTINHKIVENHAYEIVEFKKGYEFSHPIQLVKRGETTSDEISLLNGYFLEEDKEEKDKQLAEFFYISGTSYRMIMPSVEDRQREDTPFHIYTCDPRSTFVVYINDVPQTKLLNGTIVTRNKIDERTGKQKDELEYVFTIYTSDKVYTYITKSLTDKWDNKSYKGSQPNTIQMLPIVEYPINQSRLGCIEVVITILNAINDSASNRLDAIEQYVQSLMVFINCEFDKSPDENGLADFDKMLARGALMIKQDADRESGKASVAFLHAELNQEQTQTVADNLLQMVYSIVGVPDRKSNANSGGDTGQAELLKLGWATAESRAKGTESSFKKSERDLLRVALHICKNMQDSISDLSLSEIEIKFTRNRSDNMQSKVQALQGQISLGIEPSVAIATVGLYSDDTMVYEMSKDRIDKILFANQESTNNQLQETATDGEKTDIQQKENSNLSTNNNQPDNVA